MRVCHLNLLVYRHSAVQSAVRTFRLGSKREGFRFCSPVNSRPLVMVCPFGSIEPVVCASIARPLTTTRVHLWELARGYGVPLVHRGGVLPLQPSVFSPSGYGVSLLGSIEPVVFAFWHNPSQRHVCICGSSPRVWGTVGAPKRGSAFAAQLFSPFHYGVSLLGSSRLDSKFLVTFAKVACRAFCRR